ncbi:MAG: HAD-IA family hydrolase, partial [Spirochaetota bacterium]
MEQDQPEGRAGAEEAREGRRVARRDGEGVAPLPGAKRAVHAVIFDLDGTLIDSEPNYREVDSRYLLSKGILLSDEEWENVVGMGGGPFIDFLRSRFGIEGETDALIAEKDELYLEFAAGRTGAFAKTVELVRYLSLHGVPLGVGTSSRSRVLRRMLDEAGLSHYFAATVGSDEVAHPKPEPDIFLRVAERLGVDPEHCLVVEDSQYGVRAATNAGMMVVALPGAPQAGRPAFAAAELVYAGGPEKLDVHEVVTRFGIAGDTGRHKEGALSPGVVERFQAIVTEHYARTARSMPWRETDDPYAIMVSEFMLQQTQVARVLPRYDAFLERFPRVEDLARASLQEVLELWQGLGYNRRGKNLRDAALAIVERYEGRLPSATEELRTLPGVGAYTAAAIAAFGFNEPVTMIETNIR